MKLKNEYWEIYRAAYQHAELKESQVKRIIEIYTRDGKEAIYEAAKTKKLIPAIACLMSKLGCDVDFWNDIVVSYRERNLRVVSCLNEMYRILSDNDIHHIAVVENFGALLASTQDIAMFGSGDIDQYALPNERERIYDVLTRHGYTLDEVKAGSIIVSSSIRRDDFPDGFYFGINWNMTNRVNLPSFTANGDFIGWDRCRYYKNTSIKLPSPEGLMYVCLMHIAVHGFCKAPDIRLYYDIANAMESEVNWDLIIDWAERDGNSVRLSMAAYLSHLLLDLEIPERVYSIGNRKQFNKLLHVVYDYADNRLLDFPDARKRLLIDIYSNDKGMFRGLSEVICPNHEWTRDRYGSVFFGHIKHLVKLVR